MTEASPTRYRRHCFPTEIIAYAVWLYFLFPLSLRDVEDLLMAERGIDVSFQTVSEWAAKFGSKFSSPASRQRNQHLAGNRFVDSRLNFRPRILTRPKPG
ncbi:hypothetical protein FBZ98_11642 [Rhizobium sp. ERR 922]|nr:hypothetical protein FBZ98_11642 [Rhizobium sp. ERR 922]TWB87925.1 hypothetical protein FBZ97_11511 [Rhizobium sp. ERR 942]